MKIGGRYFVLAFFPVVAINQIFPQYYCCKIKNNFKTNTIKKNSDKGARGNRDP